MLRSALLLLFASAIYGCPNDPPTPADSGCFVGDPDAGPEMVVIHQTASGTVSRTVSNAPVPMIEPPQGGRVVFIGARAKNMDGCPINITTSLIDDCTGLVVGFEGRDVLMKPAGDGWIEPEFPDELANYSNLATCPVAARDRKINDETYTLEVRLADKAGRKITQRLPIRPVCAEPAQRAECLCLCRAHYVLGECPDAGTSTTTTSTISGCP